MFDPKEFEYLTNTDFLQTKRRIIQKLFHQFSQLEHVISGQIHRFPFIQSMPLRRGKVSKGENYRELPYLVLDYPAVFKREDIFSLRTIFWWGHEFSCTLHLQGKYKKRFEEKIIERIKTPEKHSNLQLCIHATPWEYYFEEDNYQSILEMDSKTLEQVIQEKPFVKLACRLPLERFEELEAFVKESTQTLFALLK
ncbi:hypothetical protein AAG747_10020 [Rapidithrix thailandica]|uniref:Uncharacterized protein n=1 Tax=Rapidithrix thailandica TaxID=413964 RepID=A0AAW9RTL3_9BACT